MQRTLGAEGALPEHRPVLAPACVEGAVALALLATLESAALDLEGLVANGVRADGVLACDRYGIQDVLSGLSFTQDFTWMEHYNETDLNDLLYSKARAMQYTGDLTVDPIRWDGATEMEVSFQRSAHHLPSRFPRLF